MPRKQRKRSMSEADQQRLEHRNTSDNDSDKEETAGGVSSASERKLFAGLFEDASEHTTAVQDSTGFRLVHFQSITQSIVEAAVCRLCKKGKLILQESLKNRQGFHVPMELACSSCKKTTSVPTPTLPEKKVPEINRRAVLAFRAIGAGQKKMEKFVL